MPDREMTPPPGKPVQDINTPVQTDGFYTILVNRDSDYYQAVYPIKRGQPYAGILNADERVIARYASNPLYFLKELRPGSTSSSDFGSSDLWVLWVFATVELAQDTYDASIEYDGEVPAYPIFTRVSTVRRKTYDAAPALAIGSTLTGLMSVNLTAPGTGYTFASATVAGGGVAQAVCLGGAIIDWIVTQQGSGVANAAGMTVVGDGTGATASTRIQPASAVLVSQKKRELPEDDPHSHDYVQVALVYETLPGALIIVSEQFDKDSGILVTKTRQKKLISTITPGVVVTAGTSVVETDMDGVDGNTAYEVKTTVLASPYHDLASAKLTYATKPYEFPGYLLSITEFIMVVDLYGTAIGNRRASADDAIVTKSEWWVIAAAIPAIVYGVATGNDVHVDQIVPGDIVINDVPYRHVLHDDATRNYNGTAITVPETIPSASEYYGTIALDTDPFAPGTPPKWIGEDKVVEGSIDYYPLVYTGLYKITTSTINMR